MNYVTATLTLALAAGLAGADNRTYYFKKDAIRVLIFSGRNNHDWRTSTPYLRKVLEDTSRFDVRVTEEPAGITSETLAGYDVLVLDYCGPRWGEATEKAVESFVRSGKGLVAIHAASYPFGDQRLLGGHTAGLNIVEPIWPEYRRLLGVYWDQQNEPRTGHGDRHTFTVRFTDREHPIAKGLGETFPATDELYHSFRMERGVGMNVIAAAFDDPGTRGSGKEEPILWTVAHGKGRIFSTSLGHDITGLVEPGFVATFTRGTEWAATGTVTQPKPAATKPLRVLVVTGGHGYDTSFYSLFDGYDDLSWDHAASNTAAFQRDIRSRYDVLVLYDFNQELNEDGRKNLRDFVESGKGLVILHHAIADYNSWPWWVEEVVGGRYLLKPDKGMPASTFKEGEEITVTPAPEKHPVTAGIGPMHLRDETYKGMWISGNVKVLLTTKNPTSDGPVAWISPYQKSRVVYIQLGHDRHAHRYPAYRKLVHNAILWTASAVGRLSACAKPSRPRTAGLEGRPTSTVANQGGEMYIVRSSEFQSATRGF